MEFKHFINKYIPIQLRKKMPYRHPLGPPFAENVAQLLSEDLSFSSNVFEGGTFDIIPHMDFQKIPDYLKCNYYYIFHDNRMNNLYLYSEDEEIGVAFSRVNSLQEYLLKMGINLDAAKNEFFSAATPVVPKQSANSYFSEWRELAKGHN